MPFWSLGKKIHNNQFEAEDALRKNGATVKMFFAINTFQSVVAGLKQPGSMTGFGNAIFFFGGLQFVCEEIWPSYTSNRCGWPVFSRTVLAHSNGRKAKQSCLWMSLNLPLLFGDDLTEQKSRSSSYGLLSSPLCFFFFPSFFPHFVRAVGPQQNFAKLSSFLCFDVPDVSGAVAIG